MFTPAYPDAERGPQGVLQEARKMLVPGCMFNLKMYSEPVIQDEMEACSGHMGGVCCSWTGTNGGTGGTQCAWQSACNRFQC